ncbi:MAG: nitrile hydratase subunit beta [Gammaproteobacteria bacterium]|nr:nitrile hydratase subunit beta [Gammaproteobacteria bacterium]
MDGIHDLGGMHGFGAVLREQDEPAFLQRWEAAVFAMVMAAGRAGATGNADRFRHAIERIDPVAYLEHGYYGRWLGAVETLLAEAGIVEQTEITARAQARGGRPDARVAARPAASPDHVPPAKTADNRRQLPTAPRFATGDPVRTATDVKSGHTRLPRYARGKSGRILTCHGAWVYPDNHAHGQGDQPVHLYTVMFTGRELWGREAEPALRVYLDLFEPYLELTDV